MTAAEAIYNTKVGDPVQLKEGDPIVDFRGDTHTFIQVTRLPSPGRSGKVYVLTPEGYKAEYYDHVFPGLEVVPSE